MKQYPFLSVMLISVVKLRLDRLSSAVQAPVKNREGTLFPLFYSGGICVFGRCKNTTEQMGTEGICPANTVAISETIQINC